MAVGFESDHWLADAVWRPALPGGKKLQVTSKPFCEWYFTPERKAVCFRLLGSNSDESYQVETGQEYLHDLSLGLIYRRSDTLRHN